MENRTPAILHPHSNRMKLQQLRYFSVLADELHFRRAAERLNITQAPLSLAIQDLERELGGPLFHRTRRQVVLTEIGCTLRESSRRILDAIDLSVRDIRRIIAGEGGELRIGFTAASSLLSFFPAIIHAFRNKYPDVHVALRDMPSTTQIAAMQSRTIDAGIIRTPPTFKCPADIASIKLLTDPLVVAVDASHRLHSRRQLKLSDLKEERFVFYPRSYGVGIYDHFIKLCAKRSFIPSIVQEAQEASTIIGLVATGLGIAVVPSSLRYIGIPNIVYIPLNDADATTQLLLVYRAGEANIRVANLTQMVRGRASSIKLSDKEQPPAEAPHSIRSSSPRRHRSESDADLASLVVPR